MNTPPTGGTQTVTTTRYYYDGQNVIAEYDENDDVQRSYVHGLQYIDERAVLHDHSPPGTPGSGKAYQDRYYLPLTRSQPRGGYGDTVTGGQRPRPRVKGLLGELYTVVRNLPLTRRSPLDGQVAWQLRASPGAASQGCADCRGWLEEAYVHDPYGEVTMWAWPLGDVTLNGETDLGDQLTVKSKIGSDDPWYDASLDGSVDLADQLIVKSWAGRETTELTCSAVDNPYHFNGRTTDTLHASELEVEEDPNFRRIQDNRNRMYDPKHGRWLQRDPAGVTPNRVVRSVEPKQQYDDSRNLYEYVQSNPSALADPSGQHGVRTLKSTENLDEPDLIADALLIGGDGRGLADSRLTVNVSCHKVRSFWAYFYTPYHTQCYSPSIDVTVEVHVRVLKRGHPRLDFPQAPYFDERWGPRPRSRDREREAIIAHEYDHRDTVVLGFWPWVNTSGRLLSFENMHFCSEDSCRRTAACLKEQIRAFWHKAGSHSSTFDAAPWLGGGLYPKHQFTDKPDVGPCQPTRTGQLWHFGD